MHILHKQASIHYNKYGIGNKILICFHGYGLQGNSFEYLTNDLAKEYTIFAIDLPFHGDTVWEEEVTLTPLDVITIINNLAPSSINEKITLLAFSMGGRVALQLLENFQDKFEQLILIAPDGLHKNKWQWLATQTVLGNELFKFTMKHPLWLFKIIQLADACNLLNKSIVKFVHYYIDDTSERMLLYKRWTVMRMFKPNLSKLQLQILQNQTPVKLLFGSLDRIILTKRGIDFKGSNPFIKIHEIHAGHQLLHPKYAHEIIALFRM
ncbi:MAG: alpha/beta hydrolase [Chitinophagaceae bacterium]